MATKFDLIYAPEDGYRVGLLQTALAEAGMVVSLRKKTWRRRSDPCLCVLSENSHLWLGDTLRTAKEAFIWIRIDDTLPPLESGRTLDLRSWPGRSADGALTELVGVLKAAQNPLPERRVQERRNRRVLGVLAFVLALAFLLPLFSSESETFEEEQEVQDEWVEAELNPNVTLAVQTLTYENPADFDQAGIEAETTALQSAGQGIGLTAIPAKNDPEAEVIVGDIVEAAEAMMCIAPAKWRQSEA